MTSNSKIGDCALKTKNKRNILLTMKIVGVFWQLHRQFSKPNLPVAKNVFGPQPVNTSNTLVWPPKQTRKFFAVKPKRVETDGKYLSYNFSPNVYPNIFAS